MCESVCIYTYLHVECVYIYIYVFAEEIRAGVCESAYIYTYMYVYEPLVCRGLRACVCECVCERERAREGKRK